MARIHKVRKSGIEVEVGSHRFLMQSASNLSVPSLVNTPCWLCGKPIEANQSYYVGAMYREHAGISSGTVLVHAEHVD